MRAAGARAVPWPIAIGGRDGIGSPMGRRCDALGLGAIGPLMRRRCDALGLGALWRAHERGPAARARRSV